MWNVIDPWPFRAMLQTMAKPWGFCCKWQALALLAEGSLDVKHPTIWTDEKAEVGRQRRGEKRKKIREEKESEERRCRCPKR